MKKWFLLFLIVAALFCVTACTTSTKTASEMQSDIQTLGYLPEDNLSINNFQITQRKTEPEKRTDTVYVTFNADNTYVRYIMAYTLKYEMYNDGWKLTNAQMTSKNAMPLQGISDDGIASLRSVALREELENATLKSRKTDLPKMEETLVFDCFRTQNAQTDYWTATVSLSFDLETCEWRWESKEITNFRTQWDYSKLAGDYHYSYSLSPYITTDVTVTADGKFNYDISFSAPALSAWDKKREFHRSGTITIADFTKKYVSPGSWGTPNEFDFGYVFLVGEGSDFEGFLLYEGKLYHVDQSERHTYLVESWHKDGGWNNYTW